MRAHTQEADDAEDMEEIDATTLMTIDELNSTAMADFEGAYAQLTAHTAQL